MVGDGTAANGDGAGDCAGDGAAAGDGDGAAADDCVAANGDAGVEYSGAVVDDAADTNGDAEDDGRAGAGVDIDGASDASPVPAATDDCGPVVDCVSRILGYCCDTGCGFVHVDRPDVD